MVPLYSARLSALGPGDFVVVECGACWHHGSIHPAALPLLGSDERLTDLAPRLRRRQATSEAGQSVRSNGGWLACGHPIPNVLNIVAVALGVSTIYQKQPNPLGLLDHLSRHR